MFFSFVWLFSVNILKAVNILCFSLLPTLVEPYCQVKRGSGNLFVSRNNDLGELSGTCRASGAVLPCLRICGSLPPRGSALLLLEAIVKQLHTLPPTQMMTTGLRIWANSLLVVGL